MNVSNLKPAPTAPVEPAPRPKLLVGLEKKRIIAPPRVLVYGQAGIGKSTFAAGARRPIFVGSEDGTSELEVYRYPKHIADWDVLLESVDVLMNEEHDFKTYVLDTVDWAEPLCWVKVCKNAGKAGKGIESLGYGKGYVAAQEQWLQLLNRLDLLRQKRGMTVVLLGHSIIRTFKNPEGDDYDHYTLKMHDKSAGILREWCDAVLFAREETFLHKKDDDAPKAKAYTNGTRVLHTRNAAAFFAKNRYSLPERLPLDWGDFWSAVQARRPEDLEELRPRMTAMLAELEQLGGADVVAKAREHITTLGDDVVKLSEVANRIAVRLQEAKEKTA